MFDKDFKHDAPKLIFASVAIKGSDNSSRFLSREYLSSNEFSDFFPEQKDLLYSRKGKIIPKFIKIIIPDLHHLVPNYTKGGMSLYNLNSRAQERASSSIHTEDIP
ncbi:hypothetical protein H5410_035585 [Solanum commersonii]|uniref:Uncharacterized protein n=1 Tax=Solanum commersonii TaxID=4109 RepID=A0A9J5Y1P2_SOLCO|nr:hypothetical protein H5410_035585 [Solanum commersonii]